jgi:DnaJ-class molecular chaperone
VPDEPTIEVKLDPCPDCKGKGSMEPRVENDGSTRRVESGGTCGRCGGKGSITRDVTLTELRGLLEQPPDDFR